MREILGIAVIVGSLSAVTLACAGQPTPFIYDSTGQLVGPVTKPGEVVLPLKGSAQSVSITATVSGLGVPFDRIAYVTTNCTGAPYKFDDSYRINPYLTLVPRANLQPNNLDTILYPDFSASAASIFSYYDFRYNICYSSNGSAPGHPLKSASVRAQGFTAPFTVKLR